MFDDFVGNNEAKAIVSTAIKAALKKDHKLPNFCFNGLAGVGKTHLSKLIAKEIDATFIESNAASIQNPKDLVNLLRSAFEKYNESESRYLILLIDEAHGLKKAVDDILLTVISEDIVNVQHGKEITNCKIYRKASGVNDFFSVILATNRASEMSSAMRSRLTKVSFVNYSLEEKADISSNYLKSVWNGTFNLKTCYVIAERAWSARETKTYTDGVTDYCIANDIEYIDHDNAKDYFKMIGIDERGLNAQDREYLTVLEQKGGVASLSTIASTMQLKPSEVSEMIEPKIIGLDLINVTSAGRELVGFNQDNGQNEMFMVN